jgi:hypothetical protein
MGASMVTARMHELAEEIVRLQGELDREIENKRKQLGWQFHDKVIEFANGITRDHRRFRMSASRYIARSSPDSLITTPIIYSLIVPLLILDIWVSLYQAVCFRFYRIPRVRRADYIALDRQHLAYLNWIEALNCTYCGYANGLVAYAREITSRTEQYWCPIKHAVKIADPHQRYYHFLEFGDAEGYRARLDEFREKLREMK